MSKINFNDYYYKKDGLFFIHNKGTLYGSVNIEGTCMRIIKLLIDNGWVIEDLPEYYFNKLCTSYKYYSIIDGKYFIRKRIGGKNVYFGSYSSEDEAMYVVDMLRNNCWNIDKLPDNIKNNILKNRKKDSKYYDYHKSSGKYRVRKRINGKQYCFGYFNNEDEAKALVKELKKNGWEK